MLIARHQMSATFNIFRFFSCRSAIHTWSLICPGCGSIVTSEWDTENIPLILIWYESWCICQWQIALAIEKSCQEHCKKYDIQWNCFQWAWWLYLNKKTACDFYCNHVILDIGNRNYHVWLCLNMVRIKRQLKVQVGFLPNIIDGLGMAYGWTLNSVGDLLLVEETTPPNQTR